MNNPGADLGLHLPYPIEELGYSQRAVLTPTSSQFDVHAGKSPSPLSLQKQEGQGQQQQQEAPSQQRQYQPPPTGHSSSQQGRSGSAQASPSKQRVTEEYSIEPIKFEYFQYRYEETINDTKVAKKFTPYIQFQWCLVLIQYSFDFGFIQHYNINCTKLPRALSRDEMNKNATIILEHGIKVLSKLCEMEYGPSLYLMGCLYSHQLDFEFLNQFYTNDPVAKQIFSSNLNNNANSDVTFQSLNKNIQLAKILPLNDTKALEYYLQAVERKGDLLSITYALYRSGVCLELGKGCDGVNLYYAMELYELGWRDFRDPLCGYKYGLNILKTLQRQQQEQQQQQPITEHYERNDRIITQQDINDAVKALHEVDTQQSLFELGKHYDRLGSEAEDQDLTPTNNAESNQKYTQRALTYYYRSAKKGYPLAIWKMGQVYECGLLGNVIDPDRSIAWYSRDTSFALNLLYLSGWLLTGGGSLQPDEAESFKLLLKAGTSVIGSKNARVQYGLARYYQYGIGCAASREKMLEHMNRASSLGHAKATRYLASLSGAP